MNDVNLTSPWVTFNWIYCKYIIWSVVEWGFIGNKEINIYFNWKWRGLETRCKRIIIIRIRKWSGFCLNSCIQNILAWFCTVGGSWDTSSIVIYVNGGDSFKDAGKVNNRTRFMARKASLIDKESHLLFAWALVLIRCNYSICSWFEGLGNKR